MASQRAKSALQLRRAGLTYREIANQYAVSVPRARELVVAALRAEPGFRDSLEARKAAYDSIKFRRQIHPRFARAAANVIMENFASAIHLREWPAASASKLAAHS